LRKLEEAQAIAQSKDWRSHDINIVRFDANGLRQNDNGSLPEGRLAAVWIPRPSQKTLHYSFAITIRRVAGAFIKF
jgi:hypothetical protein